MADVDAVSCRVCGSTQGTHLFTKDSFELWRCSACSLVAVANPPTAAQLAEIYSPDAGYHDEWADEASATVQRERRDAARQLDALNAARPPRRGNGRGTLVDVGCSVGLFLDAARSAGWAVSGVEFNAATAAVAAEQRGLDVVVGSLTDAALEPGSVDVITLWDVLEHVPDPLATLEAAAAALAEGGEVWIETPNIDGLFPRVSYLIGKRLGYWPHPEPPHHLFQFSPTSLGAALKAAGFEVVSTSTSRIPLRYTFGSLAQWRAKPFKAFYAALFAPFALVGPLVGAGDTMVVRAVRP